MIDQFLGRRQTKDYNCAHFVTEVWLHLTGQDLDNIMQGVLKRPSDRRVNLSEMRTVTFFDKPKPLCLVMMQRPGFAHVGVWYRQRVLHLLDTGVQSMPLEVASVGFRKVRFFLCK